MALISFATELVDTLRVGGSELPLDCASLGCIRYTTPPLDKLVTYAGNRFRGGRKRAATDPDLSGNNSIQQFTTTFAIAFSIAAHNQNYSSTANITIHQSSASLYRQSFQNHSSSTSLRVTKRVSSAIDDGLILPKPLRPKQLPTTFEGLGPNASCEKQFPRSPKSRQDQIPGAKHHKANTATPKPDAQPSSRLAYLTKLAAAPVSEGRGASCSDQLLPSTSLRQPQEPELGRTQPATDISNPDGQSFSRFAFPTELSASPVPEGCDASHCKRPLRSSDPCRSLALDPEPVQANTEAPNPDARQAIRLAYPTAYAALSTFEECERQPHATAETSERGDTFRGPLRTLQSLASRVGSPPPRYSEIAPGLPDDGCEQTIEAHLPTRLETPPCDQPSRNHSDQGKTASRWGNWLRLALRLLELKVGTALLEWGNRLQRERALVEGEWKQHPLSETLPSNNLIYQTNMSGFTLPSLDRAAPKAPLPAPKAPLPAPAPGEVEELADGSHRTSESEFTHPTASSELQAVKRKPFNANDAPSFLGPNVTEFLEAFEDYCLDRAIPLNECIARVPRQCTDQEVKETIEELPSYAGHDWEAFKKALLEEFEDLDPKQRRHTEDYLRSLVITDDISADKLDSFCNKWEVAQKSLIEKGKCSESDLTLILISILPKNLLYRAVQDANLDRTKVATLKTDRPIRNLRKEAAKRRCFEKIQPTPVKKEKHVSFVDNAGQPQANPHNSLRKATFISGAQERAPGSMLPPALQNDGAPPSSPSEMDDLTKRFAAITMSLDQFGKVVEQLPVTIRNAVATAGPIPPGASANPAYPNRPPPQQFSSYPPAHEAYSSQGAPSGQQPQRSYSAPNGYQNGGGYQRPGGYQPQNGYQGSGGYPGSNSYQGSAGYSGPGGYQVNAYSAQGNGPMNQLRPPCIYCGNPEHTKMQCNLLWTDISAKWIHLIGGRVHDGPEGQGGVEIDVRGLNGQGMRQRVTAFRNQAQSQMAQSSGASGSNSQSEAAPSLVVGSKSITVIDPSDYSGYQAYVTDDDLTDTDSDGEAEVYAARIEKRKADDAFSARDAKELLKKRVAREAKLPTTKTKPASSGWKPLIEVKDDMVMDDHYEAPAVSIPKEEKKGAIEKASRAKPKKTWLQSQMDGLNAESFLQRMLKGAKVDCSVWDVLSASHSLQDLIFKRYISPLEPPTVKALHEPPLVVKSSLINVSEHGRVTYLEDCPKIDVRLSGMLDPHIALVDSGAEANILTTGLVDAHSLPVSLGTSLIMKSHTGHTKKFVGVAENVRVTIGSITVLAHFFIIEDAEEAIVLGNPFIKTARVNFRHDYSGNQWVIASDHNGDEVEVLASRPRSLARQMQELRVVRGKGKQD